MTPRLPLINAFIAVASMALAAGAAGVWVQPKHSSKVDPRAVAPNTRVLESINVNRPPLTRSGMEPIPKNNLFRKDRSEYIPPPAPSALSSSGAASGLAVAIPPPTLTLRGVLLAEDMKVAFLEGQYSVKTAANKIQEKQVKPKGYFLGDHVGSYRIRSIGKTEVGLSNSQGNHLTIRLTKRTGGGEIRRVGEKLVHRDPKARKNQQVEVQKIQAAAARPQPRVVAPDVKQLSPRQQRRRASIRNLKNRRNRLGNPPQTAPGITPPARTPGTPPNVSGATPPGSGPHISGAR
ncbi:MAG: hypothetical protein ACE5ER_08305 [Nitrospinaceae bacterium]